MAFNVVLVEPLIPQNTGTIARLTAATNSLLHLIEPLGFEISDRYLKRAGLDYWPWVKLSIHKSWKEFLRTEQPARLYIFTAYAEEPYWNIKFQDGDYLVFGNETKGFNDEIRKEFKKLQYVLPMENQNVRSLNVSCSVSTVLYEAIRQVNCGKKSP